MKLTLSGYARKLGVSRQRVYQWVLEKRIKADNPTPGVWLIDSIEPRPKAKLPWEDNRLNRIEMER